MVINNGTSSCLLSDDLPDRDSSSIPLSPVLISQLGDTTSICNQITLTGPLMAMATKTQSNSDSVNRHLRRSLQRHLIGHNVPGRGVHVVHSNVSVHNAIRSRGIFLRRQKLFAPPPQKRHHSRTNGQRTGQIVLMTPTLAVHHTTLTFRGSKLRIIT